MNEFAIPDRAPDDVVPPRGLTLEGLRQLNDTAGRRVVFAEPGEVLADLDGIPIAIEPPTIGHAVIGGATVTLAEVLAVGADPDDYPHLNIIDTHQEQRP